MKYNSSDRADVYIIQIWTSIIIYSKPHDFYVSNPAFSGREGYRRNHSDKHSSL